MGMQSNPVKMHPPREHAITVVSGLPRSGTSMLMQMLAAGGVPVLQDDCRPPDEHNPHGYFEYAPAKRLKEDHAWLGLAQGKSVKIVSHFLEFLPDEFHYNLIFLLRDLKEVLASQRAMLQTYGQELEAIPDAEMRVLFERHLGHIRGYLETHQNFRTLFLNHADILAKPREAAVDIDFFLGGGLDVAAMCQTVEPSLYRQR